MEELLTNVLKGLGNTLFDIVIIVVIFFIARMVVNLVSKITRKTMNRADDITDEKRSKEIKTSMTLTHSANRYIVYIIAIAISLNILGYGKEVSSAIVAAGIGGLVLSLGAQSIVKDMLAGIFLLFEKQFLVGDYVKIGEFEGTVDSIALRATYLNSFGKKIIIPNGEIRNVINYSRVNGFVAFDVPTKYKDNTRKIMSIIDDVVNKYYDEHLDILTENRPPKCEVNRYNNYSIDILVRVETRPLKHWNVERELKLLIKEEFVKKKIEIPSIVALFDNK